MTPSEIANGSRCIDKCIPDGMKLAALVYLMGERIGMTDPADIMNGAKCINKCIPAGMQLAALIFLLSTSSSGADNLSGSGSPVGVITPDAVGQFYSDFTNSVLWQSTGLTSADWKQWI